MDDGRRTRATDGSRTDTERPASRETGNTTAFLAVDLWGATSLRLNNETAKIREHNIAVFQAVRNFEKHADLEGTIVTRKHLGDGFLFELTGQASANAVLIASAIIRAVGLLQVSTAVGIAATDIESDEPYECAQWVAIMDDAATLACQLVSLARRNQILLAPYPTGNPANMTWLTDATEAQEVHRATNGNQSGTRGLQWSQIFTMRRPSVEFLSMTSRVDLQVVKVDDPNITVSEIRPTSGVNFTRQLRETTALVAALEKAFLELIEEIDDPNRRSTFIECLEQFKDSLEDAEELEGYVVCPQFPNFDDPAKMLDFCEPTTLETFMQSREFRGTKRLLETWHAGRNSHEPRIELKFEDSQANTFGPLKGKAGST